MRQMTAARETSSLPALRNCFLWPFMPAVQPFTASRSIFLVIIRLFTSLYCRSSKYLFSLAVHPFTANGSNYFFSRSSVHWQPFISFLWLFISLQPAVQLFFFSRSSVHSKPFNFFLYPFIRSQPAVQIFSLLVYSFIRSQPAVQIFSLAVHPFTASRS